MEQLSVNLFWLALIAASLATLLYWGHAFGLRLALRRFPSKARPSSLARQLGGLAIPIGQAATVIAWLTAGLLAVAVVARWRATGHAPWSNMWEYSLAFAAGISLAYVIFERWYGQRILGPFIQPLILGLLAAAAAFFPSDVRPLLPALQNEPLLAAHVAMMVLAYSALSVSFGAALLHLVQGEGNRFWHLPKAAVLDEIGYRAVLVGFPLLALGIALGAYWANSAWGRYWDWDPKETSSLLTWLIYAGYLHMRGLARWQGTRSAVLLVVGFLAVLFTYFGVNLWVSGLHSYSGL